MNDVVIVDIKDEMLEVVREVFESTIPGEELTGE